LDPILGVLVPGVLVFGVVVLGVAGIRNLGALRALDGLGSRRPLRGLRLPRLTRSLSRVMARYFKGCFVRGSIREIEDILLSEYNSGNSSKGQDRNNGYISCGKKNKYKQDHEIATRKYRF
jgi:hypothetical protein